MRLFNSHAEKAAYEAAVKKEEKATNERKRVLAAASAANNLGRNLKRGELENLEYLRKHTPDLAALREGMRNY